MLLHGIANLDEQIFGHFEAATKVPLCKNGRCTKIVVDKPLMHLNSFSPDELTAKHGTIVLRLLPLVQRHYIAMFSSSMRSNSSSDEESSMKDKLHELIYNTEITVKLHLHAR